MLRLSGRTQKYIVYGVELFLVYIIQFTPSLLPAFFGERPCSLTREARRRSASTRW